MKTPRVSAAKMPAKSFASGLSPCEVEITPPSTVDLVGSARLVVVNVVVDVVDCPVVDDRLGAVAELIDDWPVVASVVVTEEGAGGEAKLGLIAPGRMLS